MSYNPIFTGRQSTGSSVSLITNYYNNTGLAIPQGAPCSTQNDGSIGLTDVTSQASVQAFVGYANVRIPTATLGPIISTGRLENLSGYSFSIGDAIYMSVGGSLQNIKPVDINGNPVAPFTSGDSMVFCGVIVKGENNPLNQDLQIFTQNFGIL